MSHQLLTLAQVLERTTLKRSTFYELVKAKEFPRPLKLGTGGDTRRTARWLESDVDAFIEGLVERRGES